nr:protein O-linked-mannose beta-1,2-N-acetylglucosaminyltransferase 1-like [Cherax quadricarinatus]
MTVLPMMLGSKEHPSLRWRNIASDRAHSFQLTVTVNTTCVTVSLDGQLVYTRTGEAVSGARSGARHSGVHLLAVHQVRGQVMMARHYLTYQPAEHARLREGVMGVQRGRVLLLVGVPEWVMFLGNAAESVLRELGSAWAARAAQGEAWAWVGVVGGPTIAEGISTRQLGQYPSASLHLSAYLARTSLQDKERCSWYTVPSLQHQVTFCERYEGYNDLCTCHGTYFPGTRMLQEVIQMKEVIPVVVITANKPHHLYRLLRNLFSIAGSSQTEVLVVVDGAHQETLDLTELLNVTVTVHRPEGIHSNRTNANVRFALYSVFREFPRADKAIVLEDDLLLSPDFLRYFHHVAPLLDLDPTVFCINAFSSNSYSDTASDPRVLLRARSYPMYGWMVKRSYASQIINHWVPPGIGDWDWWLTWEDLRKGRDVVFPEVSRTFHSGSAGVHVSGFEQEIYFNRMIYNQVKQVNLMDVNLVNNPMKNKVYRPSVQELESATKEIVLAELGMLGVRGAAPGAAPLTALMVLSGCRLVCKLRIKFGNILLPDM